MPEYYLKEAGKTIRLVSDNLQIGYIYSMSYEPQPLDTEKIDLQPELLALRERLAENTHALWTRQRLAEGWRYGPKRDDEKKEHPGLVPYSQLSEAEKEYDRITAMETLKAIVALGYRIRKAP